MCSPRPQLPVGCPLVALAPQWRQNYPNNRPPTPANAISEMGHFLPPALQKKSEEVLRLPLSKYTGCYGTRVVR
jgi:hypothetical protein